MLVSSHVESRAMYNLTQPIPLRVEDVANDFIVEPFSPSGPCLQPMKIYAKWWCADTSFKHVHCQVQLRSVVPDPITHCSSKTPVTVTWKCRFQKRERERQRHRESGKNYDPRKTYKRQRSTENPSPQNKQKQHKNKMLLAKLDQTIKKYILDWFKQ